MNAFWWYIMHFFLLGQLKTIKYSFLKCNTFLLTVISKINKEPRKYFFNERMKQITQETNYKNETINVYKVLDGLLYLNAHLHSHSSTHADRCLESKKQLV